MRVFVALVLPDSFRRELLGATAALCAERSELRWIAAPRLHLTLAFLGDLDDRGTDIVEEAAERVASGARPFTIAATGLLALPHRSSCRVLAASIGEGSRETAGLAEGFELALVEIGSDAGQVFRPRERRPFAAHITLARSGRVSASFTAGELGLRMEASATVEVLAVYESLLGAGGAQYRELGRFGLGFPGRVT